MGPMLSLGLILGTLGLEAVALMYYVIEASSTCYLNHCLMKIVLQLFLLQLKHSGVLEFLVEGAALKFLISASTLFAAPHVFETLNNEIRAIQILPTSVTLEITFATSNFARCLVVLREHPPPTRKEVMNRNSSSRLAMVTGGTPFVLKLNALRESTNTQLIVHNHYLVQ